MSYKILGVDDSKHFRSFLEVRFNQRGHEYKGVAGWAEFNELYRKNRDADLLLIDLYLDGFNGSDIIRTFRKYFDTDIPILILSSRPHDELQQAVEDCGANGYVRKDDLTDAILEIESTIRMFRKKDTRKVK